MKFEEVIRLLNISESTLHNYCKKGIIRKIKLDNGINDYNDDDIKNILNDRKKKLDDHKKKLDDRKKELDDKIIVLIDPKKQAIEKTYNNVDEVIDDLEVTKDALRKCLTNNTHTAGGYILKYNKDITDDNLKLYSSKHCYSLDDTRRCSGCKEWVDLNDFRGGICIHCDRKKSSNYVNSYNGFFNNMARAIKKNAKARAKKEKTSGVCTIDAEFLKKLYENQKGLCYYSGIAMNITIKSHWQASPERLDNTIGYTEENTKLICLEFNIAHGQWNKNKINLLKTLRKEIVDITELEEKIKNAKLPKIIQQVNTKRKNKLIDDIEYYECTKCNDFKIVSEFRIVGKNQILYNICKVCEKIRRDKYNNSFKGFLMKTLQNAKDHAKIRQKNKNRKGSHGTFNLTIDDLFDKLLEQKGKCYYSGVPLIFKNKSEWMMSIERLDSTKGYVKDNIVLICVEFNSTDTTASRKNEGENNGSGQWSKEKINFLMETINEVNN